MTRYILPVMTLALGLGVGWVGARRGPPPPARPTPEPRTVSAIAVGNGTTAVPAAGAGALYFAQIASSEGAYTEGAKRAGEAMLRTLDTNDPAGCREAHDMWQTLLKSEHFGGEYGTLDWLCGYLTTDEAARAELTKSPEGARLVRYFDGAGWHLLRRYVATRYQIGATTTSVQGGAVPGAPVPGWTVAAASAEPMSEPFLAHGDQLFLHELIRFEGPYRAEWEQSADVVAAMGLKPGAVVADLGAGQGYFTYRLADAVGSAGRVYALELRSVNLDFIRWAAAGEGRRNIEGVLSTEASLELPENSVDVVFICNLYHLFYGNTREADRAQLIDNIRRTLRPGGRLIIVDNTPEAELPAGELYYHGFAISPKLVSAQLTAYGFQPIEERMIVPQRYLLSFRKAS